ncbi:hypothetical protein FOL47_008479 [Perkinsus chesapeaki]|uniref:Thymus-specific serine protease n=1 Tax=Perkinsus chesapeaki TaxID=330153 RepID=A0A7J6LDP3_PERCH|nr:hypothetical protein FOL47_008479 [Perkinsus chesapeaki]
MFFKTAAAAVVGFALLYASVNGSGVFCPSSVGKQYFGYKQVTGTNKYFYATIEADQSPEKAPTFLYLPGGPGQSSIGTIVTDIGPCTLKSDGKTLQANPFSWTRTANGIWIDAPGNTGFSAGPTETTVTNWVNDLFLAFTEILKERPSLNTEIYLMGASADASSVSMLMQIIDSRAAINVKGILIMSGMMGPLNIYRGSIEMAGKRRLVSAAALQKMVQLFSKCKAAVQSCQPATAGGEPNPDACQKATEVCNSATVPFVEDAGHSIYDLRVKPGEESKYFKTRPGNPGTFLNLPNIQRQLGVSKKWVELNQDVFAALVKYASYNTTFSVTNALDNGIKVLVIAGDQDYTTNAGGALGWMTRLSGRSAQYGAVLAAAKDEPIKVGSEVFGMMKSGKFPNKATFTYIKVNNAGHMLVQNQPTGMLQVMQMFLRGEI